MPMIEITRRDAKRLATLLQAAGKEWTWLADKFDDASKTKDQQWSIFCSLPVSQLELSVRTANVLQNNGIETIEQLLELSTPVVMSWKNAGRRTAREIEETQKYLRGRIA